MDRHKHLADNGLLEELEKEVSVGRTESIVVTIHNGIYDYYRDERWLLREGYTEFSWDNYLDWARDITNKFSPHEEGGAVSFMQSYAYIMNERLHQRAMINEPKVCDFVKLIMRNEAEGRADTDLSCFPKEYHGFKSIYDPAINELFYLPGVTRCETYKKMTSEGKPVFDPKFMSDTADKYLPMPLQDFKGKKLPAGYEIYDGIIQYDELNSIWIGSGEPVIIGAPTLFYVQEKSHTYPPYLRVGKWINDNTALKPYPDMIPPIEFRVDEESCPIVARGFAAYYAFNLPRLDYRQGAKHVRDTRQKFFHEYTNSIIEVFRWIEKEERRDELKDACKHGDVEQEAAIMKEVEWAAWGDFGVVEEGLMLEDKFADTELGRELWEYTEEFKEYLNGVIRAKEFELYPPAVALQTSQKDRNQGQPSHVNTELESRIAEHTAENESLLQQLEETKFLQKKPGRKAVTLEECITSDDKESEIEKMRADLHKCLDGPSEAAYINSLVQEGRLKKIPSYNQMKEHGLTKVKATAWNSAIKPYRTGTTIITKFV